MLWSKKMKPWTGKFIKVDVSPEFDRLKTNNKMIERLAYHAVRYKATLTKQNIIVYKAVNFVPLCSQKRLYSLDDILYYVANIIPSLNLQTRVNMGLP